MNDDFFVPEERLLTLKATPAGRCGEGGYNYQRAYAVARLAAMYTALPLLGLSDFPKRLRYDWADDLDELLGDGSVCFTQCKSAEDIGAPAKLARVLMSFAAKWLWTPDAKRTKIRFRLVSCDSRFARNFAKDEVKAAVWGNFKSQLTATQSSQSDQAEWQEEADLFGHEPLFDALWASLEFIYLPREVNPNHPAGPLLHAEEAALAHLGIWGVIWGDTQKDALSRLRCLIHENLILFDPTNQTGPKPPQGRPRAIDSSEVRVALFAKEKDALPLPFAVVDRIRLANTRRVVRHKAFLFEAPEWHHVVHGADERLNFVERDQTAELANFVRERLIAPLLRGTSSLSALFVTGPPGAGKSTLVRRVSVQLIDTGEVVVADAGHNLTNYVPGGIEPYIRQITKLAQQGRPVLLILDDPLIAESEWIDLIKHLKQPGLPLAVISPTPDFLYHNHQHELQGVRVHTFSVNPPSANEKKALARLYGHPLNKSENLPDDFIVMVAVAAERKPFPEIMQRLWGTLSGGQGFGSDLAFKNLPWQVRAFWFVCALHRANTPCPLPILQEALTLSGGTGDQDVSTALRRLKSRNGWNIFRVFLPERSFFGSAGDLVSTSHQKIASAAWDARPCPYFDKEVNAILTQATLHAPMSMFYVAEAAGTLTKARPNPDSGLADELMRQWTEAAVNEQNVETRFLCSLVAKLQIDGGLELVRRMSPSLAKRASGHHGWLTALQLRSISAELEHLRSFPRTIDLDALIANADFSIAPIRAIKFYNTVGKNQRDAIISQLCASLDRTDDWHIDSKLLSWLVSNAPQSKIISRLGRLQQWLNDYGDDANVRTQYLVFIQQLPKTPQFDQLRQKAATETAQWLADSRHEFDAHVRTQYLVFIQQLPKTPQFDQLRQKAATGTARWLADSRHEFDANVRTQYLVFIQQLPKTPQFDQLRQKAATETAQWLADSLHEFDLHVRTQYLVFIQQLPKTPQFDQLRQKAATETGQWLADQRHEHDTTVRTQYLVFIQQLPKTPQFDKLRQKAATETAQWLADSLHEFDLQVRTQYLVFIQQLPKTPQFDKLRQKAATETAQWLADPRHEQDTTVRTQYPVFIQQFPMTPQFDELRQKAATETAQWLADPRHEQDTTVRTQFLMFIKQLPLKFNELRKRAALDTATWLKKHPESFDVCSSYLSFLLDVRHPDLATLEAESVTYHQLIIEKDPNSAGNHLNFGDQLLRLKKFLEAKAEYERVLTIKPDHQLAHRGMAIALQHLGEIKEAEDSFKKALKWARKKNEKLAIFNTPLGRFYLSQKRWSEAIKSFEEAGEESPEYYGNHWGVAQALNGMGKLSEAIQSLKLALDDPKLRSPAKEEIEAMRTDILQRLAAPLEE